MNDEKDLKVFNPDDETQAEQKEQDLTGVINFWCERVETAIAVRIAVEDALQKRAGAGETSEDDTLVDRFTRNIPPTGEILLAMQLQEMPHINTILAAKQQQANIAKIQQMQKGLAMASGPLPDLKNPGQLKNGRRNRKH